MRILNRSTQSRVTSVYIGPKSQSDFDLEEKSLLKSGKMAWTDAKGNPTKDGEIVMMVLDGPGRRVDSTDGKVLWLSVIAVLPPDFSRKQWEEDNANNVLILEVIASGTYRDALKEVTGKSQSIQLNAVKWRPLPKTQRWTVL